MAAMEAQRRAALPQISPILWARCSEAQLRLFDFSNELRSRVPVRKDALHGAAEEILRAVQEELQARASPLEIAEASELGIGRLWAIHALSVVTSSHSCAKRFELEITGGAPLAICLGTGPWYPPVAGFRSVQRVQSFGGVVYVPKLGCYSIIPESTRLGGVMWRYWCDDCAPRKGAKACAQARKHKRLVDEIQASERSTS